MSRKIEKNDINGRILIKKEHQKKWRSILIKRRLFFMILIALQMVVVSAAFAYAFFRFFPVRIVFFVFSAIMAIYILSNGKTKTGYKLIWVFLVLVFPFIGWFLYGLVIIQKRLFANSDSMKRWSSVMLDGPDTSLDTIAEMEEKGADVRNVKYLASGCGYPVYNDKGSVYYPEGEDFFNALITEIEKAEKYIFIEIFIIDKGVFWDSVLDVLERKAAEGLDVRVMCDDLGCVLTLPGNFRKMLEKKNIKCRVFNRFKPIFDTSLNFRDHRKIISVDGKVAFSGGINLADEYINTYDKFGYWKDTGFLVKDEAAWKFTKIFLSLWNYSNKVAEEDIQQYMPASFDGSVDNHAGYVQPYAESPLDKEGLSENVFLNVIHGSRKYLYIMTPYFIVNETIMRALTVSSKSGVDVRIIVPAIPDKKLANEMTKSYYDELLSAGIKVYEYTPGFIHAKEVLADDEVAVVGTVNFDYRSLDLHFEDGCCFYNSNVINQVKDDFIRTFEESEEITLENHKPGPLKRLFRRVASIFGTFF